MGRIESARNYQDCRLIVAMGSITHVRLIAGSQMVI